MRLTAVCVLTLAFASTVTAQLTPGFIVRSGEPFPIVADFNGDGLDDLIQEKNVILNNGTSLSDVRDLGFSSQEKVFAALDMNGDHILDLLTVERSAAAPPSVDPNWGAGGPRYRLYIGDASRKYSKPIDIATGGPQPYVADVDGDGKDDLVVMTPVRPDGIREMATDVTVLLSRGDGTFELLAPFRIARAVQIVPDFRVLTGDINHDGLPDLVIRCVEDLVILRGTGGGKFEVQDHYVPQNMEYGWWSTRLADIDGDSNPDVILVGFRRIRVFFGDGHGNFPRVATTSIAKVHNIDLPPSVPTFINPDNLNQPRDLAVGHFTRSDQMQIAAGTSEGDIVVFSYDQGALKEVARTRTEFWALDIRPGSFRSGGNSDLYVMGTLIWGDIYPRPRLFNGAETVAAADTPLRRLTRGKASRPVASDVAAQVQIRGDCIDQTSERFVFARDGVFGVAQRGDTTIEALFDAPSIYFRLSGPYAKDGAIGVLSEANGSYSGTANVLTSCGWKAVTVTAKLE